MPEFSDWISALLDRFAPGVIGSGGALLWLPGTWPRKLALFVLGVAVVYYLGPWMAEKTSIPETVVGLILGFFSMAIIDRALIDLQRLNLASIAGDFMRRWLGLPPAPPKD